MKVLIACEFSGTVRDAFTALGYDAWSCDLLPSETPGNHFQGDVLEILYDDWDLIIAHPPCDFIANSGNTWYYHPEDKHLPVAQRRPHPKYPERSEQRKEAIDFFKKFQSVKIKCPVAIENPIPNFHSTLYIGKYSQIIQPWMFGHPEKKATCLWLYGLPLLKPANNVYEEMIKLPKNQQQRLHYLPPSPDRAKLRSKTFPGIGKAMAEQWSEYIEKEKLNFQTTLCG